jgi:hypothetical protein
MTSSASAATIFFTDRTAWEAAVSGVTTETYESYPWSDPNGNYLGVSPTLGDYNYDVPEGAIYGVNSTALTYDAAYLTGNYLEWQQGSPNALQTVVIPGATSAIGFDYGQFYGDVATFLVTLSNGDSISVLSNINDYAFIGAISTAPFSSFTILSDPFPIIDNLSRAREISAVPEPASMVLLGTGLAGIVASRRRRGQSKASR